MQIIELDTNRVTWCSDQSRRHQHILEGALVVAQLVKRSLPTPVIGKLDDFGRKQGRWLHGSMSGLPTLLDVFLPRQDKKSQVALHQKLAFDATFTQALAYLQFHHQYMTVHKVFFVDGISLSRSDRFAFVKDSQLQRTNKKPFSEKKILKIIFIFSEDG